MFKNVYADAATLPYFEEVYGPWKNYQLEATCAVAADFTKDRREDLIICHKGGPPMLAIQLPNDAFRRVAVSNKSGYAWSLRNARVADMNRDGIKDLIVTTWGTENQRVPSYVRVFRGIAKPPYFNFTKPAFEARLPWSAPDLEIVDVNKDGIPDIYVVQADETVAGPCNTRQWHSWDPLNCSDPSSPPTFVPPLDLAKDLLFVGQRRGAATPYVRYTMNHAQPGCGWIAKRWDRPNTMLLQQASFNQRGYSMILEW
jgi:FG-GAP-like repeat